MSLALDILRREFEVSMALTGTADARNVDRRILVDRSSANNLDSAYEDPEITGW